MFTDWQNPIRWQVLNDEINTQLNLKSVQGRAHLAPGVRAALVDVVLGICKQNPHKKRVAVLKHFDPTLDTLSAVLSREGVLVQQFERSEIDDEEKRKALFQPDMAAIVASEDDPLLGVLLDLSKIAKMAEEKKTPLVQVSHSHHRYVPSPTSFNRFLVHILGFGTDLSLVLSSERYRWPVLFLDSVSFAADTIQRIVEGLKSGFINPDVVNNFEAKVPAGGLRVFNNGTNRILDRAIVYWPDLDGHAVAERLYIKLGLPWGEVGQSTTIETTSLHRWGGVKTMDWLKNHGFDETKIRGAVILDQCRIDSALHQLLESVCQDIRKIQTG